MINQILHGDCLELMKDIPDGSIDMVLCDLPYGTTACAWDVLIPFDLLWQAYYRVLRPNGFIVLTGSQPFTTSMIASNFENFSHQWIWEKAQGVTPLLAKMMPMKNFEDVLVFTNPYTHDLDFKHPQRFYFEQVFKFIGRTKREIISTIGQRADHCFRFNSTQYALCTQETYIDLIKNYRIDEMEGFTSFEILQQQDEVFNTRYPRVYNPQMVKGKPSKHKAKYIEHLNFTFAANENTTGLRYPTSILRFNRDASTFHPTQKPVALFEYLLKTYTNEGMTVLDNCCGSGTTAEAAILTGRNFICMEKELKYVEISRQRVENLKWITG